MPRGKAAATWQLIEACHVILEEIQPATVRAVGYRLFTLGLSPDMSKASVNRIGTQLVYARENGIIPWSWIVDETRRAEGHPGWDDPEAYAEAVQRSYRRNRWLQQDWHVEVWSEKGTVRGTLAPVLDTYGVEFRVMHGYGSATALHDVAELSITTERPMLVFYVGDYDPSGLHMSEVDLPKRVDRYHGTLSIQRLALSPEDVRAADLPWFDADTKRADPRYRWYSERYGARCWELDALSPVVLRERAERAIRGLIDWDSRERCDRVESAERSSLLEVLGAWKEACA